MSQEMGKVKWFNNKKGFRFYREGIRRRCVRSLLSYPE